VAGIKLDYHFDFEEPRRAFQALKEAQRQELAATIGEAIVSETRLNFEKQQGPDGTPWPPIKPETIAARSKRKKAPSGSAKTLIDHGHLSDSITYKVGDGGNSVEVGSNMEYAAIHQFGGDTGRNGANKIEARPYLGLNSYLEEEIVLTTLEFYKQVLDDVN
jgi:phage virion morphogenesis protein